MNDFEEFLSGSFPAFADLPKEPNDLLRALKDREDALQGYLLTLKNEVAKTQGQIAKVLISEIHGRFFMGSKLGIEQEVFKDAINEILSNMDMCRKICDVESAFGSELTIYKVTDEEIVLVDTRKEPNSEAQVNFLRSLDRAGREYELAVQYLEQKFHDVQGLSIRKELAYSGQTGVHYYDDELICACTGADFMTKGEYKEWVKIVKVDIDIPSWIKSDDGDLNRGVAMLGFTNNGNAIFRLETDTKRGLVAARPILRFQRNQTTPTA